MKNWEKGLGLRTNPSQSYLVALLFHPIPGRAPPLMWREAAAIPNRRLNRSRNWPMLTVTPFWRSSAAKPGSAIQRWRFCRTGTRRRWWGSRLFRVTRNKEWIWGELIHAKNAGSGDPAYRISKEIEVFAGHRFNCGFAHRPHGLRRQSGSGDAAFGTGELHEAPSRSAPPKAVSTLALCHRSPS